MISSVLHTGLSVDPKSLGDLRTRAVKDPQGALREVARQFEALMLDRMVKSMRTAAPGDSLFDGEGTRMFTELLDHEYAAKLAAQGGLGLADMLVRQLSQALHPSGQEIPKSADK